MSSIDIYAILESKPHNSHYLKRYYKFIKFCQEINQNIDEIEYTENHHICPKAYDLFPEYTDLRVYAWNSVNLTARQHILAHVMLWKAYGGSQTMAIDCMVNKFNSDTNANLSSRKVPTSIAIRYSALCKEDANLVRGEFHKGKATFKDAEGNTYYLSCDDPVIQELGLVGKNSGTSHSEESIAKMSASKLKYKKIILYCLNAKTKISAFDDNLNEYLAQGWLPFLAGEDRELRKLVANKKVSNKTKGNCRFMYQDGTYYGVIKTDDPIIQELNLVPHVTENQRKQMVKWSQAAADSNRGTNIYNNGVDEARFDEDPGGEWKIGRLPRSPEWDKKQKEATSKQGHKFWNNGVECRLLKPDEAVPEGWVPGMIKRGPRKN